MDSLTKVLNHVRVEAGLGNPPTEYINNDPESANFMIKHGLHFCEQKPHEFIAKIKDIVETQQRNEDRAVFGKGPYRLRKEFVHLGVDDRQRSQLTHQQMKKKLVSYHDAGMNDKKDITTEVHPNETEDGTSVSQFQIVAQSAGILNVPQPILDAMITKATNLLSTPGNVIPTPGAADGSYIVAGTTNKIHSVKPGKGGSWTCDRACVNKPTKICEHVLAVAQVSGRLNEFLAWFRRTRKRPNMMGMVEQGGPKSAGKKPSTRKRSNVKARPISEHIDLLDHQAHECNEVMDHQPTPSTFHESYPSMAFPSSAIPKSVQSQNNRETSTSLSMIHEPCHFPQAPFPRRDTLPSAASYRLDPASSLSASQASNWHSMAFPPRTMSPSTGSIGIGQQPTSFMHPQQYGPIAGKQLQTPPSSPQYGYTQPSLSATPTEPHQSRIFSPQTMPYVSHFHGISQPSASVPVEYESFSTPLPSGACTTSSNKFHLKCVAGTTISKCYGCGGEIANPPHVLPDDLVIVYRDIREYRDRVTGQLQRSASPQNVHFHLRLCCIFKKYPQFHSKLLVVSADFLRLLRPEHLERLLSEFGWTYMC